MRPLPPFAPSAPFAGALLLALAGDVLSKAWALQTLEPGLWTESLVGPLLLSFNPAGALGLGASWPAAWAWLWLRAGDLGCLALLLATLALLHRRLPGAPFWGEALMCAGALGNMGEQLLTGTATDFLVWPLADGRLRVFNIADVWLFTGFLLFVPHVLVRAWRARTRPLSEPVATS